MKHLFIYLFIIAASASLVSCNKNDYKSDGGLHNPKVEMTTYEYLKSKPQFSSLVYLIERAGLKDTLNSNITFFATTNYGINDFLSARKNRRAVELHNENIIYTLDSLPVKELKDSLKMYMFKGDLGREKLTLEGQFYNPLLTGIPNVRFYVKLRRTRDYSAYIDHVDYVQFTKVVGTLDATEPDQQNIPDLLKDVSYDCQTSGILTNTGTIHVLSNLHRLFYNTEPLAK
jgi:hypothetical protein